MLPSARALRVASWLLTGLVFAVALAAPRVAQAHSSPFTIVDCGMHEEDVVCRFLLNTLSARDLVARQRGVDPESVDPKTLGDELATFEAYVRERFVLRQEPGPCPVTTVVERSFAVESLTVRLYLHYRCPEPTDRLTLESRLFVEEADSPHSTNVGLFARQHFRRLVLTPDRPVQQVDIAEFAYEQPLLEELAAALMTVRPVGSDGAPVPTAGTMTLGGFVGQALGFVGEGFVHILAGPDHLLFVFALVVVVRRFRELALVITAFTVAHSITLALGAFELVVLPSWLVESAIAASIVYVAVENLVVDEPKHRHVLTFVFGLVHGFGFARQLAGMEPERLAGGLLGFNIGVELGQLLVVAPLVPILFRVRKASDTAALWVTRVGSALVGAVGLAWLVDRVFGVGFMPF